MKTGPMFWIKVTLLILAAVAFLAWRVSLVDDVEKLIRG